jgi:dolichyl-phosphate-mannose-protein mannosyltransferase
MSAITSRRGLALIERLLDALTDSARRERAVAVVLLGYVAVWTLYAVLAKGSQDIHVDLSEQYVLSRELAWGYPKHPPLDMWIVRAWFTVFPTADWAFYLLAMANAGLALWIIWRLSGRFLDAEKRVVGLALLTLVPFFNFHALKFNVNTLLIPLWAATTLWFLRSFETRRLLDAALAGLFAALAMNTKYWSIFLLLGLGIAALADVGRAAYFRSGAPWVTIAVGGAVMAPHAVWLVANDYVVVSYAVATHAAPSFLSTVRAALGYLGGSIAYVAPALVIFAVIARPSPAVVKDMAWPQAPERRLAAMAFWVGLLSPALIAPVMRLHVGSVWSMSAFALLPMMLLSSPLVAINRRDAMRVLALAVVFPFVMAAVAPAIAFGVHRTLKSTGVAHSSVVVDAVERLWRETSDQPLKNFSGYDEFTDGVSFYMHSHPLAVRLLDGRPSQEARARVDRDGTAMLCPERTRSAISAEWCHIAAISQVWCSIPGKEAEIEASRRYLGVDGTPARYRLYTIPPWQFEKLLSLREPLADFAARRGFKAAE